MMEFASRTASSVGMSVIARVFSGYVRNRRSKTMKQIVMVAAAGLARVNCCQGRYKASGGPV